MPGCKEEALPHEKIKGKLCPGRHLVFTEKKKTAVGAFSESCSARASHPLMQGTQFMFSR